VTKLGSYRSAGGPARIVTAGGTPALPDIEKWASYLRRIPKQKKYDLVLTDIRIGDITSLDVLRAFKMCPVFSNSKTDR
jgi:CheY-like chemotaxis protein